MKKSQALKMAQLAVLANERIDAYDRLEVLKVLLDEEELAKSYEEYQERKGDVANG